MKQIQHISLLTLVGTLLVLAISTTEMLARLKISPQTEDGEK